MDDNMKRKKIFLVVSALFLAVMVFVAQKSSVYAELPSIDAASDSDIQTGINNNNDINITRDINVTKTITVPETYSGKIGGNNHTLTLNTSVFEMFRVNGGTVSFENVNLDGSGNGRLIRASEGSNVTVSGGSLKNGRSWNNATSGAQDNSDGGALYAIGSDVRLKNTTIEGNKGVKPETPPRDGMKGMGGAVAVFNSNLTVENSTVSNNVSGAVSGGGFVYSSNSRITATGNTFSGNHTDQVSVDVNQGGVFYIKENSVLNTSGNTYNIAKTFNTGGAIYSYGSVVNSTGDTFLATNLGDLYGISAGAIMSHNATLNVDNGTFKVEGQPTKLTHAGGMIGLVGGGEANIITSNFTGNGSWWNGPTVATYGGAIAFETGSNITALIENSTFRNFAADQTGGAITISTRSGEKSSNNVTIRNSNFINNRSNLSGYNDSAIGGAIYVGPGNTVRLEGGKFQDNFARRGGAIYNDGNLDISNGTIFNGNTTYMTGGAIYNNGELRVDESNFTNNRNAENRKYPGKTPDEYIGGNIYAKKDVTITPKASFDENDVRVLDKESAILLTGTLTNKINVSISEAPISDGVFSENPSRYVGYTVARGTEGYTPVSTDSERLHYVSYNQTQPVASYEDNTSVGEWDYVLAPNNTVVLGQRAKVVYDANGGSFEDRETKKEQLYVIYSSVSPWTNINQITFLNERPTMENHKFVNWYNHNSDGSEDTNPVTVNEVTRDPSANLFNRDLRFVDSTSPITNIVNPNMFYIYAGYEKYLLVHFDSKKSKYTKDTDDDLKYTRNVESNKALDTDDLEDTIPPTPDSFTQDEEENGKKVIATYTFVEWNTKEDGTGTAFNGDTVVTEEITLYGKWNRSVEPEDPEPTEPEEPEPTEPVNPDPIDPEDPDPIEPLNPDPSEPTDPVVPNKPSNGGKDSSREEDKTSSEENTSKDTNESNNDTDKKEVKETISSSNSGKSQVSIKGLPNTSDDSMMLLSVVGIFLSTLCAFVLKRSR